MFVPDVFDAEVIHDEDEYDWSPLDRPGVVAHWKYPCFDKRSVRRSLASLPACLRP